MSKSKVPKFKDTDEKAGKKKKSDRQIEPYVRSPKHKQHWKDFLEEELEESDQD